MQDERTSFEAQLAFHAAAVEREMTRLFDPRPGDDEIARPERLVTAMRYAVLNGGKRLRPFLLMEVARLFAQDEETAACALSAAAALECVHCYSLVHDDLPAMDDDELRRGLPTVHVAYDEATAILVGDALLTLAFDIMASPDLVIAADRKVILIRALARASGLGGMVGGQMLDLESEHRATSEEDVLRLQAMKTGGLIRYACEAGAIIAGANATERQTLRQFGETIGLAFQLADDLLDVTAEAGDIGKATGKDAARGKGTLVSIHGAEWAKAQLGGLVTEAETLLSPFGERAATLIEAARFVATRRR
jgi:farnesyl diphosphate synthase